LGVAKRAAGSLELEQTLENGGIYFLKHVFLTQNLAIKNGKFFKQNGQEICGCVWKTLTANKFNTFHTLFVPRCANASFFEQGWPSGMFQFLSNVYSSASAKGKHLASFQAYRWMRL